MSTFLYTLGHRIARRRWQVLVVWCVLGVTAFAIAGLTRGELVNDYTIPGTESQRGIDALAQQFPQASGTSGQVVFTSTSGPIADQQAAIEQQIQVISCWTALAVAASVLATTRRRPQLAVAARPPSPLGAFELSLAAGRA